MNWKKKTGILLGSIIFVAVMSFLFTFTACGKTPESTACVHEWGEYTAIKDATCTEKGIKERQCAKCGETEKEEIAALGHTEVADEAIEPTCTATGKTAGKHCSVCHEVLVAQEEIAALGHTYANEICTRCGEHEPTKELKYSLNGDGASYTVVGIENENDITEVYIPCVYEGKPVTSIGEYAFSGCSSLTSINIPNSVTSIGWAAFSGCSDLTSIIIPNGVTMIEGNAFSQCSSLTSITLPESLTILGESAFSGCSSLTSITIPNSVTKIGDYTFRNCSNLTSIIIPNGVTIIQNSTFFGCSSLTSITLPKSLRAIYWNAFYNCSSLTSIIFEGTKAEWNAITKYSDWNGNTGAYSVHCTDGDIEKADS